MRDLRHSYAEQFALAEETLNLAGHIFNNRRLPNPEGDELLGSVALGLLFKITHVFWAIIAVAERALPSASLAREMAEAVFSLAYLLKADPVERAWRYRDRIVIQDLKDMNRMLDDPEVRGDVTEDYRRRVEENRRRVIERRGQKEFDEMYEWRSWGGNFSIEEMAKQAHLRTLYTLLYAKESRAAHGIDITSHAAVTIDGTLIATLPSEANRHLVPATVLALIALHLGTRAFNLDHVAEINALLERARKLGKSGAAMELTALPDTAADPSPRRQGPRGPGGP